jgi:hypothetical protein
VPPLPVTLKKSASLNSQASVVWATKTMSSERYSRRSPAATQKKNVFRQLPIALRHAARDVEQKENCGAHRSAGGGA